MRILLIVFCQHTKLLWLMTVVYHSFIYIFWLCFYFLFLYLFFFYVYGLRKQYVPNKLCSDTPTTVYKTPIKWKQMASLCIRVYWLFEGHSRLPTRATLAQPSRVTLIEWKLSIYVILLTPYKIIFNIFSS